MASKTDHHHHNHGHVHDHAHDHAAVAPGALDTRTKELIALAIGVVEGCDGCIASHAQAASRAGASREEAAEAIGVTFLMKGGPATIYGPRAYDAFCEFADARDAAGEQH